MSETDEEGRGRWKWRASEGGIRGTPAGLRLFTRMAGRAQEPKLPALSTGACDGVQIVSAISCTHRERWAGHSHPPDLSRSPAVRSGAPRLRRCSAPGSAARTVSHRQLAAAQLGSEPCYTDEPPFLSENANRTPSGPVMGLARRSLFSGARCHPSPHRCPCQSRPSEGYNLFTLVSL